MITNFIKKIFFYKELIYNIFFLIKNYKETNFNLHLFSNIKFNQINGNILYLNFNDKGYSVNKLII